MKVKYQAILTVKAALKAVEIDGDALRYVFTREWFVAIAAKCGIDVEL